MNHYCTYSEHWVKADHAPRYDINEPCPACKVERSRNIESMRQEAQDEQQRQRGARV